VVVTRQWGNKYGNHLDYIAPGESKETLIEENETGCIIRTAYKPNLSNRLLLKYGEKRFRLLRKAITAYYEFMQFLFFIGPKAGLYRGAKQYLKQHKVDAIIATGEPFILFKYANKLSKTHNIPWIADYRDPWSQDLSIYNQRILKQFYVFLEKQISNRATIITTPSDYFKLKLGEILPQKQIELLNNGFDQENPSFEISVKSEGEIHIAFVGTLYNWHPVKTVLDVVSSVNNLASVKKIHLNFYGINEHSIIETILDKHPEFASFITFYDKLDNKEMLKELASNHFLLLFNYYAFMGTKVYDYIAVNRPIIFCFTNEPEAIKLKDLHYGFTDTLAQNLTPQLKLLNKLNKSVIINDKLELENKLSHFVQNMEQYNGVNMPPDDSILSFSRKEQSKTLCYLLKNII
jgi:hypothetical protein